VGLQIIGFSTNCRLGSLVDRGAADAGLFQSRFQREILLDVLFTAHHVIFTANWISLAVVVVEVSTPTDPEGAPVGSNISVAEGVEGGAKFVRIEEIEYLRTKLNVENF
jgi:hypothetical protein